MGDKFSFGFSPSTASSVATGYYFTPGQYDWPKGWGGCSGCATLQARVHELERRERELLAVIEELEGVLKHGKKV